MTLKAKLCMFNVPADGGDVEKTRDFYAALLGIEFIPAWTDQVESYHAPVSADGIKFSVQTPGTGQKSAACIFAVDDLEVAKKELKRLGGRVVVEKFSLPIAKSALSHYRETARKVGITEKVTKNVGNCAILKDPSGNSLVLVELENHAKYSFKTGAYNTGLTERQIAEHKQELEISKHLHLKSRKK